MKYKCPKCKSTDIHGWREDAVETRYKITKEGKLYSKPYKTIYNELYDYEGLICNNCGEKINSISEDITEWML